MISTDKQLLEHLGQFVSDHKKEFVDRVLDARTRHLTVVLEDVFQSQNATRFKKKKQKAFLPSA